MAVAPKADLYARAVADRDEIAAFLRTDRRYAAYALGDLDGPNRGPLPMGPGLRRPRPADRAGDAPGRPRPAAAVPDGRCRRACAEVLSSVIRPRDAYLLGTESARCGGGRPVPAGAAAPPCTAWWSTAARFVPFAGGAERLTARDIDDLNRLYQLGFRAGFPSGVLEDGIYYGVRVRGRLVSAAGTHVINTREGIAVVGNVMTQRRLPRPRLRQDGDQRRHRRAARRASTTWRSTSTPTTPRPSPPTQRLGYRAHCLLTERLARRRAGGWGIMRPIREALRLTWPRETR